MTQVTIACPICALPLVIGADPKSGTDTSKDGNVGGHIHMDVSGTASCANSHEWIGRTSFILDRSR